MYLHIFKNSLKQSPSATSDSSCSFQFHLRVSLINEFPGVARIIFQKGLVGSTQS